MPFIVVRDENACSSSKPWAVFTETGPQSGRAKGSPHGCHTSRKSALKQAAAMYVNVPEAKAAGEPPPNLRDADEDSTERCATCEMFFGFTENQGFGFCSGYSNVQVQPDQVCDSYSPDDAQETKSSGQQQKAPPYAHVPDAGREEQMTATLDMVAPELIPNTREWRRSRADRLIQMERRRPDARCVTAPMELRGENEDGIRVLRSYASLFDTPYSIRAAGYDYTERVRPGAFRRSLGHAPDVVFRYDHTGPPLARTSSGTLRLGEDERGLWYEADLNLNDPDVKALIPKIERGDLRESSFAFRCLKDQWNDDLTERDLSECELDRGDVSVVTFGASRATGRHMTLRSEERLEELRALGFDAFLTALVEWRDYTLVSTEERTGKVLSSASLETLRAVLGLMGDIDDAADEGQAMLADLMGVPNPDAEDEGDGSVTDSEQLDHVSRSEGEDSWDAIARLAAEVKWDLRKNEDGTITFTPPSDEERNDPTMEDWEVAYGLRQVKMAIASVKATQLTDPDNDTDDTDDAAVMAQIEAADAAIDAAIVAQAKDGRCDDRSEEDAETEKRAEAEVEVETEEESGEEAEAEEADAERSEQTDEAAETEAEARDWETEEIENVSDLLDAIQSVGRAKDEGAAKLRIKRSAQALGRTDLVPDDWRTALVDNDTEELFIAFHAQRLGIGR